VRGVVVSSPVGATTVAPLLFSDRRNAKMAMGVTARKAVVTVPGAQVSNGHAADVGQFSRKIVLRSSMDRAFIARKHVNFLAMIRCIRSPAGRREINGKLGSESTQNEQQKQGEQRKNAAEPGNLWLLKTI